ncbi:hypothetical protein EAG_15175 [Camponotus floridanus]|uniref:Uncharacterized protein n=1 Tax=Camponotus floridanus TaxID=104421 RepID=E2AQQ8_CAMFO|nr:hypothetical protein EAG_15175 [Camponotus floridanus]
MVGYFPGEMVTEGVHQKAGRSGTSACRAHRRESHARVSGEQFFVDVGEPPLRVISNTHAHARSRPHISLLRKEVGRRQSGRSGVEGRTIQDHHDHTSAIVRVAMRAPEARRIPFVNNEDKRTGTLKWTVAIARGSGWTIVGRGQGHPQEASTRNVQGFHPQPARGSDASRVRRESHNLGYAIFDLNIKEPKKQSILIVTPFNVGDRAVGHRRLRLHFHSRSREARWYRRHPRLVVILVVPFFSRVIFVGAAQSFHSEKWPTTGGWRYASPGSGPTERPDGQTHNENVECPAERDMKTSLRNGNGQNTGSGPI